MKYVFVLLVYLTLLISCNRDASGIGESSAPALTAPASAPAAVGAEARPDSDPTIANRKVLTDEQVSSREPGDLAEVDEAAARKEGPGRLGPVVRPRSVPPPAPPTPSGATSAEKKATSVSVSQLDSPLVFAVRTAPCRGYCQQYELRLHADGKVVLNGIRNVSLSGYHLRQLPADRAAYFRQALEELRDRGLVATGEDRAPADVPTRFLSFPDSAGELETVPLAGEQPVEVRDFLDAFAGLISEYGWTAARE